MKLWLAGKINPDNPKEWQFIGVFGGQLRAIRACKDETFFVAPVEMNQELPLSVRDWPGLFYPMAGKE